jgi:hypothetical protein
MKTRIWRAIRVIVFVWGCVSLLGVLAIAGFLAWQLGPASRTRDDSASIRDVRFVLNWCGLGDQRIQSIAHSHVSGRSFTGDYLDAFAIRVSHVDASELTAPHDSSGGWYRGDQLPQALGEALDFISGWRSEIPWFPREEELRSSDFYVYSWEIVLHGTRPTATQLILVRPSDKMVFYLGCKT